MAILYFEVQAKYDKLIELQKKIGELKNQLASLDLTITPKADISKIQGEMATLKKEIQGIYSSAVIAGKQLQNAFSGIKITTPQAKEFADNLERAKEASDGLGSGISSFTKRFTAAALALKAIEGTIETIKGGVNKIVDFEAANSRLAAILGLTSDQLRDMTESAEKLGRTTVFTASQVVELQTVLSKLGFTRDDILAMQESVLYFAQATGSSLDDAAATTGAALRMFGVEAKDYQNQVGRYTGAMAAATMRSALDFRTIADNLATFGPMAHSMNLEIEDTLALFGTLKNMGIEGSTAMTSLRNIFTKVAQGKIEGMGNVKSLEDFVEGLKNMSNLDPGKGMKMIGPRGGTQFITLIQQADEILKLRDTIREQANLETTSSMGTTMTQNVAGSIKMLQSAWEGFVLSFQKSAVPLKGVLDIVTRGIQGATEFVTSGKGDLPLSDIQTLTGAIMGVVAAMTTFRVEQKLVNAGYAEQKAAIVSLLTAKGKDLDSDLKLAVSRKVLSAEEANHIMALREKARVVLQAKQAELSKLDADIKALTASRANSQAALASVEAEIARRNAILQTAGATERQIQLAKLKTLTTQRDEIATALNTSAIKLNTLEEGRNTLSNEVNAMSKALNTQVTQSNTMAQLVWNKAMTAGRKALDLLTMGIFTNPYMLLAAAIGAIVYVLYDWITASSSAEIAQNNLNKAMGEYSNQLDNNKSKAEQLRNTMKDQTATAYQQLKAYKELIATYRNFAGLTKEQIANMPEEEYQSRINAENDKKRGEYIENRIKALRELQQIQRESANKGIIDNFVNNSLDSVFGTQVGFDAQFKDLQKKYNIDLSGLFEGAPILGDLGSIIEEALRAAYTEARQFNEDMQAANKESVSFTTEEAQQLTEIYKRAEGLSNELAKSNNGASPINNLLPDADELINEVKAKITELQKEYEKTPTVQLGIKLDEYAKILADMEGYKRNLQIEMSKSNIIIGLDWKPSPLPMFPRFNYSSGSFQTPTNTPETKEEDDKNAPSDKEIAEAKRNAEKLRSVRAKIDKERKESEYKDEIEALQSVIDAMEDGTDKKIKQIELDFKKQTDKINKEYAKIKETYLNQERDIWLAKNPKSTEGDWLKSSAYQNAKQSFSYSDKQTQKRDNDLLAANAKRVAELMKLSQDGQTSEEKRLATREKYTQQIKSIEDTLAKVQSGELSLSQQQNNTLEKRLKLLKQMRDESLKDEFAGRFVAEFGSFDQRVAQLSNDYKTKAEKARLSGNESEALYYEQKGANAASEIADQQLKEFTANPLYVSAMSDALFSQEALTNVKNGMDRLMQAAASSMDTASFSKYLETYENVSQRLIQINPFQALKTAKDDLVAANMELETAKTNYEQILQDEEAVQSNLMSEKESLEGDIAQEKNADKKAAMQAKLNDVNIKLAQSYQRVANSANKLNNAQAKVNKTQTQVRKSSSELASTLSSMGDLFSSVGELAGGSIGSVLTQTGSLINTTLSSIDAMQQASSSSAKGIAKVAQAVQQATAILAIIQVAWQLISTIVSLFDSSEKKYQERIATLEGELDALEYQFQDLKEAMDEAWGLDAIKAYTDAVASLNNMINTQKEIMSTKLSKSSSNIFGGYHSLGSKINDTIGNRDWYNLTKALNAGGFAGSIKSVYDLINLSPEALKYLMSTSEWVKIAGLIASQENKAYKGTEFLDDLREYADKAKDVEDQFEELATKMNGISFDSLKEEFRSLVQEAETSINDITKSWDAFMRDAIYNQVASTYEKELEDFYNRLANLNQMKNEGKITDAKYRAALAELRAEYIKRITDARNEYEQGLTDAGVNRTDVEQSATQGGFESMSEDTGTELNGRFAALQATNAAILDKINLASFDKMNAKMDVLAAGMGEVSNWVQETQTIIANSYLELQGIRENTEVIIKPIKEMAGNVQELKDKLI